MAECHNSKSSMLVPYWTLSMTYCLACEYDFSDGAGNPMEAYGTLWFVGARLLCC